MDDQEYRELLKDISASLKSLTAMTKEITAFLAGQRLRTEAQMAAIRAQSPAAAAAFDARIKYINGTWPLRNGDGYQTGPQPRIVQPSPDPEPHADSKTGHLRSSDFSGSRY